MRRGQAFAPAALHTLCKQLMGKAALLLSSTRCQAFRHRRHPIVGSESFISSSSSTDQICSIIGLWRVLPVAFQKVVPKVGHAPRKTLLTLPQVSQAILEVRNSVALVCKPFGKCGVPW
jgi:hypothetical protein